MSYKINILGAGPAGLYAAARLKDTLPDSSITIYEKEVESQLNRGMGYTFIDETIEYVAKLGRKSAEQIVQQSPTWNMVQIHASNNQRQIRESKFNYTGVTRSKLIDTLRLAATSREIPIKYQTEIDSNNIQKYLDTDLTIIATGVNRFLTTEQATPFKIAEGESGVQFQWYTKQREHNYHTLTVHKLNNIPVVINEYPITQTESAAVIETLHPDISKLCDKIPNIKPTHFKKVRFRGTLNSLVGNVLLIGDAACQPYFGMGVGVTLAFRTIEYLTALAKSNKEDLTQRVQRMNNLGPGSFDTVQSSCQMIDNKMNCLAHFDELSASQQIEIITGRGL